MRSPYLSNAPARPGTVTTHEGGTAYEVDPLEQLRRFLVLGTVGNHFYATEDEMTKLNYDVIIPFIDEHPVDAIRVIAETSDRGLAPKNTPAVVALAVAMTSENTATRSLAYRAFPKVIRTGADLFTFFAMIHQMRGSSAGLHRAINRWYTEKSPEQLAYQLIKYQGRQVGERRVSHADVLTMHRPTPPSEIHADLFRWAVGKQSEPFWVDGEGIPAVMTGYLRAHARPDLAPKNAAALVREFRLTHEMIPSQWKQHPEVWAALLEDMPAHALLRNLGNLAKHGVIAMGADGARLVEDRIADPDRIKRARVHPLAILLAARQYGSGQGMRGDGRWTVNYRISDALDAAFYLAFANVEPVGGTQVIALDVSASTLDATAAGVPLKAAEVAACMAMVTARTEPDAYILPFDTAVHTNLVISPKATLNDVMAKVSSFRGGGTYTSRVLDFIKRTPSLRPDGITYYTDSETADHITMGMLADLHGRYGTRAVGAATASNRVSVLRSDLPWTLNVAGFSTATPQVIAGHLAGRF